MISQIKLKELLHYDPLTGIFTWRVSKGTAKAGDVAAQNTVTAGYTRIVIDRVYHRAHRLAWLYVYGYHPPDQIDHINRVRDDNRIVNLRLADSRLNNQNASAKGYFWDRAKARWIVTIIRNGVRKQYGSFKHEWAAKSMREFALIDARVIIQAP